MRGIRLVSGLVVAAIVAAVVGPISIAMAAAPDAGGENLLLNSEFKSDGSGLPANWKVNVIPPCGFSYQLHQSGNAPGEFEFISEQPTESTLVQTVMLKPGWYELTAEIKVEALGSEGSSPELFAKAIALPVQTRTHPMGWKTDWHQYQLFFKVGPSVDEVAVGCALGGWGSPNTGRILMRNPVLVPTEHPQGVPGVADVDKFDLQAMADARFGSPQAKEAFNPLKYPVGRGWTVIAVYLGFVTMVLFGWWATSLKSRIRRPY